MSVQKERCSKCKKSVTVSGLYYRVNPKIDGEWKPKYSRLPGAWRCSDCGFIHLREEDALRICTEVVENQDLNKEKAKDCSNQ